MLELLIGRDEGHTCTKAIDDALLTDELEDVEQARTVRAARDRDSSCVYQGTSLAAAHLRLRTQEPFEFRRRERFRGRVGCRQCLELWAQLWFRECFETAAGS